MGREIPNFYDRYKGKFPDIIKALDMINRIANECGLGELFLNGDSKPKCFGGCEECDTVKTYQASATSKFMKISNKSPMFIEIEKGFQYKVGGNPDYFINFRVQTELLNRIYDQFMDFFDRCFSELTGTSYNLILSQDHDNYINLVYVPLQRKMGSVGFGDIKSDSSLVWLIYTIVGNFSYHEFYNEGLSIDILSQLSDVERYLIKEYSVVCPESMSELIIKLSSRLNDNYQKVHK